MRAILLPMILALTCGCEAMRSVGEMTSGDTAALAAKRMYDPYFPDERREGINYLVDHSYGKKPPYTLKYRQLATQDPDYTVRAVAIRALNRARDRSATDVFIKGLTDANDLVRLEAVKALANVPEAKAVDPLSRLMSSAIENKDVRIAAAEALRHYHDLGVARVLVNMLNGKDFGVAWQARKSLVFLTGRDLHYDQTAWMSFLTGANKPLG